MRFTGQIMRFTTKKSNPNPQPKRIIEKCEKMEKIRMAIATKISSQTEFDGSYIELVHTYPSWFSFFKKFKLLEGINSAQNPYGHTLISFFRYQNKKLVYDKVINVGTVNGDRTDFIHEFYSHHYFFNSEDENNELGLKGNQQNGMLNRTFISLAIKVNEPDWHKLIEYYKHLICRTKNEKDIEF